MNKLKKGTAAEGGNMLPPDTTSENSSLEPNWDFSIIYYNAWENDSCPEAIIPIICSFSQLLEGDVSENSEHDEKKKVILNTIKKLGPNVLGAFACHVLHIDTETGKEIVSCITDAASDVLTAEIPQTIYDSYSSTQEKKDAFIKLAEVFATEDKPLLIFIDELDRCRPTFAIETLESVKHFFDLPNVIFVFSLDSTQLRNSIQAVYGKIDSVGYLQRFFDYEISLPETSDYRAFLSSRLRIGDISLSVEIDQLTKVTEKFSLSLRDLNVICNAYMEFLGVKPSVKSFTHNEYESFYRRIYVTLIALKYKNPLFYLQLLTNGLTDDDMNDVFWRELFGFQPSTQGSYQNLLTKEVLETDLSYFRRGSANPNLLLLLNRIMPDSEGYIVASQGVKLTLRQAIMNNVDSGVIHQLVYQDYSKRK